MNPATKLLLNELSKRFADELSKQFTAQDRKWDRRFSSDDVPAQVASKLPTPAAAATTSPPTTSSAATIATFGDTTIVNLGSEHATTQHVGAEDDTPTSYAPTRCSTLVPTPSPTTVTSATTTSPTAIDATTTDITGVNLVASAFIPGLAAPSAEGTPTVLPTKCSTQCLSRDINVLKSAKTLAAIWSEPPPSLHFMPDIPLDMNKYMQGRYITCVAPSLLAGVVLQSVASQVQKVSNGMSAQIPMHASVVDIVPWPPPHPHCTILPSETQLSFSLWPLFSIDWVAVENRPPWPPPLQFGMQDNDVQLRSSPWPFFDGHTFVVQSKSLWSQVFSCLENKDGMSLFGISYSVDSDGLKAIRDHKILLCDTMQLYFSSRLPLSYAQEGVKRRPPWPPPTQWVMQNACAQLRPIPWPSFDSTCQILDFRGSSSLHMYLKLMVSRHSLQVILVIHEHGFHRLWLASFTLETHSDVSNMLLHKSSFISWIEVYWMLFPCYHRLVLWKLPWVYRWLFKFTYCFVVSCISNWTPTAGLLQLSHDAILEESAFCWIQIINSI